MFAFFQKDARDLSKAMLLMCMALGATGCSDAIPNSALDGTGVERHDASLDIPDLQTVEDARSQDRRIGSIDALDGDTGSDDGNATDSDVGEDGNANTDQCEPIIWYADIDNDGYGDPDSIVEACSPPGRYVNQGGDCNDLDRDVKPSAIEVCDGVDNDCDGGIDLGAVDAVEYCLDQDRDGLGNVVPVSLCDEPDSWSADCNDCDDYDYDVTVCGASEVCSTEVGLGCIPEGTCSSNYDCMAPESLYCDDGLCAARCEEEREPAIVEPNILFVLDRSGGMNNTIGRVRRWNILVETVSQVIADDDDASRYGLVLFPDRDSSERGNCQEREIRCEQASMSIELEDDSFSVPLHVGPNNASRISSFLTETTDRNHWLNPGCPGYTRNPDCGMAQAAQDPGLSDDSRASYVILLTAGGQNRCLPERTGCPRTEDVISQLNLESSVKTFVMGFRAIESGNQMRSWAEAGGVDYGAIDNDYADHGFMLIESSEDFSDALWGIMNSIRCRVQVAEPPANQEDLLAFLDDVPVDLDPDNGWTLEDDTVTFHGASCDMIQSREIEDIRIIYTCGDKE